MQHAGSKKQGVNGEQLLEQLATAALTDQLAFELLIHLVADAGTRTDIPQPGEKPSAPIEAARAWAPGLPAGAATTEITYGDTRAAGNMLHAEQLMKVGPDQCHQPEAPAPNKAIHEALLQAAGSSLNNL